MVRDRWIIGAYEVKTSTFVRNRGILGVWAQAVLEALALNYMAHRGNGAYFIPVFGGDLHQHLVVHAAPKKGDFMLHAAKQADPDSPGLAVRYMRYLLQKTKDAVDATLQGKCSQKLECTDGLFQDAVTLNNQHLFASSHLCGRK